jgi:hypothetical protein
MTYVAGSVTVGKAALTITASSGAMTYGGTVPVITPIYNGFVNGQNASSLTAPPTCSTVATGSSPVAGSPYASSCTGAVDPNYSITYVAGSVTVSQATQTITFTSTAPTSAGVGGKYTPTATATSGLTVALTVDASSASVCSISGGIVTFNAVGTCLIDANQAGNANYGAAPQVQQSVTVWGAPLSTGTGYLICGGCSATSLESGDSLSVTFNGTVTLASTWSLTVADGAGNVNTINNTIGTATQSSTGGGTDNVVTYTLTTNPVVNHGTNASFTDLEVLSQSGVLNAVDPWNLPGSGRATGGIATSGITRIFDGSDSSLGAGPAATATASTSTITVTACTASDTVNVYMSNGVSLGSGTCGSGGSASFTTAAFTSGQSLLVTQESSTGYETLASQVTAS